MQVTNREEYLEKISLNSGPKMYFKFVEPDGIATIFHRCVALLYAIVQHSALPKFVRVKYKNRNEKATSL